MSESASTGVLQPQFGSLSALVQHYESSGNYTAQSGTSTASGAYQFTNPTWARYAAQVPGASQYATAASAPPAVQDAVFQQAVETNGLNDWTCPGCNPALSSYVNSYDVSQLPIGGGAATATLASYAPDPAGQGYGTSGVSGDFQITDPATGQPLGSGSFGGTQPTTSTASGDADVGFAPGIYGGPQETGLSPGTAATVSGIGTNIAGAITGVGTTFSNFFTGWIGSLENWVGRGFLILIGLVILAIALWRIVDPDGSKTAAITRNVEVAA